MNIILNNAKDIKFAGETVKAVMYQGKIVWPSNLIPEEHTGYIIGTTTTNGTQFQVSAPGVAIPVSSGDKINIYATQSLQKGAYNPEFKYCFVFRQEEDIKQEADIRNEYKNAMDINITTAPLTSPIVCPSGYSSTFYLVLLITYNHTTNYTAEEIFSRLAAERV